MPISALSKLAVAPGPLIRVTPSGEPFKEVKLVAVVPSKLRLAPSGNTSMYCVRVAPPVKVNLFE